MLYLHHSNHLEQLARHFVALQQSDSLPALEVEQVVVQNSGMGRWLSLQTAQLGGISANIRYLFPAEMTWELLRKILTDVPEKDPCAPITLRWRLLDIFLQEPGEWGALHHYLATGAESTWQLAGQLAKVFDQYLFFRPEWIREWEAGKGATEDWQASLWWQVAGQQQLPHWVHLQDHFAHALATVDKSRLPRRISFFSVPVLSPGYVQLLAEVAEYIDIHIYLMNPSPEYWGDVESEKRKRKQQADVQGLYEVGNPLLASWGRQGRDFIDQLIEANAQTDDLELFIEPDETTLLQQVQSDIFHLQLPELLPSPFAGEGLGMGGENNFPSVSFHTCHSPMREVEVLYQQLLDLFAANPDLTPADVVVMTPDIDTYAPYLDAVFSGAAYPLPFSIADRSPGFAQGILNLCGQLLELPQGRCDAESVLALLEFDEVRNHLGLDEALVMQCREWVRSVNIRWGVDTQGRQQQGGAGTPEHTWRYGLERLLLGYAMPGDALFEAVLPFNDIEGSQAEVLGRLQAMLDAIFALAAWDGQEQPFVVWDTRFRQLLKAVVGEDAPLQPVWQALDNLHKTLVQANFAQPLPWSIFQSALEEQLDKRSESEGFLGRGITFCALMPMRTVPFRFVGLIGMNDGVFPRRDVRASFDRMGNSIRRGDRLKRDEDRYLFLESLLSARDWLYISYVGQSQQDNSELPPSVLVSELQDYLERCGVSRSAMVTKHSLQGWGNPSSILPLSGEEGGFAPPLTRGGWEGVLPPSDSHYRELALSDLIRFYQNPARVFLRERFGLSLGERDHELPGREPFGLEGYSSDDIRACIFAQLEQQQPAGNAMSLLRAQGLLPHGKPGDLLFVKEQGVTQTFFDSIQPLPELTNQVFSLSLDDFTLSSTLGQLSEHGREVYTLGHLSYWQWLDIGLHHLVLNVLEDIACLRQTLVFSPGALHCLQPVTDARDRLAQLLAWYWQGLQEPLPFFPKTAFNLIKQSEPDVGKAMSTWEGSGNFAGECEKPEYRLLYRHENPLETQTEAFMAIADGVFGWLFAALAPCPPCGGRVGDGG
jgi:exodeoxyribonuclease V gamma subunit